MKGAIIYRSGWGNCAKIASAIGRGLTAAGMEVEVKPVKEAGVPDPAEFDFILLGSSTHMGRASGTTMKLAKKLSKEWRGRPFATFSTGASVYGDKPNMQACERLYEKLEESGLKPLAEPFKAGVKDPQGPLVDGEEERASEFGRQLGVALGGSVSPEVPGPTE